ncbi:MAG: hypothetical protein JRJ27_12440 [Deltaproteobacteria bacterium]|nr:hypothetical protein [Deltaproteobacteria bacterium]
MSDMDPLLENVPLTNEELKNTKKHIRQEAVKKVEKDFIVNALIKNDWNVTRLSKIQNRKI